MPGRFWLFTIAAWLGIGTIAACKDRGDSGTRSGAVGAPAVTDTGQAPGAEEAAGTGGELTDANIVALLDEANQADSAAGAYALAKATNPEVKVFAKLMMGEHRLKALIEQAKPVIEKHLDLAEEIQKKLGKARA